MLGAALAIDLILGLFDDSLGRPLPQLAFSLPNQDHLLDLVTDIALGETALALLTLSLANHGRGDGPVQCLTFELLCLRFRLLLLLQLAAHIVKLTPHVLKLCHDRVKPLLICNAVLRRCA